MELKKIILTFLTLTLCFTSICQEFEGIVTYKFEIRNPMPDKISDSLFFAKIGSNSTLTQVYYYKDGKYKSEITETKTVQLFDPKTIRLYNYIVEKDTASWTNGTKYFNEVIEIEKIDKTEIILGLECEAIKIKSKLGETIYYFSKKYKLDANKFSGHKYGHWEDYLNETGALPLKSISKTAFSYIISTAINIEEKKLSDKLFELPKFKYIKESLF